MDNWMIVVIAVAAVFLFFTALYAFLICPSLSRRRRADLAPYIKTKYAHRGLHSEGIPENSMAAFRAAVDAGYGIELDVRLSHDGELVVFHDETLERVCGVGGKVEDKDYFDLRLLRLHGSEEGIPKFSDVLSMVGGRVPLLIEIKAMGSDTSVAKKLCELLKGYTGAYIIESFNPISLSKVKELMPEVLRGQLCDYYFREPRLRKPIYFISQYFLLNFKSRPDFVAYNVDEYKNSAFKIQHKIFRAPAFAWTVTSAEAEKAAYDHGFSTVIFEGYRSEK